MASIKPEGEMTAILDNIRTLVGQFGLISAEERKERQLNLVTLARAHDGMVMFVLWIRVELLDRVWVFPVFPEIESKHTFEDSPLSFLMGTAGCISFVELDGNRMLFNCTNMVRGFAVGVFRSEREAMSALPKLDPTSNG